MGWGEFRSNEETGAPVAEKRLHDEEKAQQPYSTERSPPLV